MRSDRFSSKLIPVSTPKYNRKTRPFVDRVRVLLSSGRGGDGVSIMGAVKNQEFAGPAGGNGGQGGHVFLRASPLFPDLHHIRAMGSTISAGSGFKGKDMEEGGRAGSHVILDVPIGTVLRDADTNTEICDTGAPSAVVGQTILVLEGGMAGRGNASFRSSICVSPISATKGLPGNSLYASLELKILADVALVGLPNAGKSSILSAITTSRPEIAPYPFTTLNPYVGKLYSFFHGDSTCNIADLPGLVAGAYENRGLGHQFLQHVERSKLIALVVDMSQSSLDDSSAMFGSSCGSGNNIDGGGAVDAHAEQDAGDRVAGAVAGHPDSALASQIQRRERELRSNTNNTGQATYGGRILTNSSNNSRGVPKVSVASPEQVVETLIQELRFYDPSLPRRIAAVLCNKMDVKVDADGVSTAEKFLRLQQFVKQRLGPRVRCFPVSANIALNDGHGELSGSAAEVAEQKEKMLRGDHHSSSSTLAALPRGGAISRASLTPEQKQMILDELNSSGGDGIGAAARASGLPSAVEFLTKRVFELQRREKNAEAREQNALDEAERGLYRERNRTLLEPTEFEFEYQEKTASEERDDFFMSESQRASKQKQKEQNSRDEAVQRLLSMREGRRNSSGQMMFDMNKNNTDAHTSCGDDDHHTEQRKKKQQRKVAPEALSMVDLQLGDGLFAPRDGPLAATYGVGSSSLSELEFAHDAMSRFRVNSVFSGDEEDVSYMSEMRAQRRATYRNQDE